MGFPVVLFVAYRSSWIVIPRAAATILIIENVVFAARGICCLESDQKADPPGRCDVADIRNNYAAAWGMTVSI
jgi:hypothetical protein